MTEARDTAEGRICRLCSTRKPWDQFHNSTRNKGGKATECKSCLRVRVAKWREGWSEEQEARERARQRVAVACRTHGLTPEEYHELHSDPRCHACGTTWAGGKWRRHHIDHDHETGAVRGLLCHPCNTALGLLGDDPERIQQLLTYRLERAGDYAGRTDRRRKPVRERRKAATG